MATARKKIDLLGDPIRTGRRNTRNAKDAEEAHRTKTTGFAVGVSGQVYDWLTLEADARQMNRQQFANEIFLAHIKTQAARK